MRFRTTISLLLGTGATAVAVAGAAAAGSSEGPSAPAVPSKHHGAAVTAANPTAADLRVSLGQLFGEHAVLAMNATNLGVKGSPAFKAAAAALDQNSVELSKAIGSVYGAKAAKVFLDGKFMWRAHVNSFVDYTVALAKKDKEGQAKAVADLQTYTKTFGAFLAGATKLPPAAVTSDLLGHVFELKSQLDAYAAGNYAAAAKAYRAAYAHMFMTSDLIAGAIAKQKGLR